MRARPSETSSLQLRLSSTGNGSGISGLQLELQDVLTCGRQPHGVDGDRVTEDDAAAGQLHLDCVIDTRGFPHGLCDLREMHRLAKHLTRRVCAPLPWLQEFVHKPAKRHLSD